MSTSTLERQTPSATADTGTRVDRAATPQGAGGAPSDDAAPVRATWTRFARRRIDAAAGRQGAAAGRQERGARRARDSRPTRGVRECRDAGLATAEYAVVLIAAVGFAGLLVAILSSDGVRATLLGLVQQALTVG